MTASRIRVPLAFLIAIFAGLAITLGNLILIALLFMCLVYYFVLYFSEIKFFRSLLKSNPPAIKARVKWKAGISPQNYISAILIPISIFLLVLAVFKEIIINNESLLGILTTFTTVSAGLLFEIMDGHKNHIFIGHQGILEPFRHYEIIEWCEIEALVESFENKRLEVVVTNGKTLVIDTKIRKGIFSGEKNDPTIMLNYLRENYPEKVGKSEFGKLD